MGWEGGEDDDVWTLGYEHRPARRRLNPWIAVGVACSICLGLAFGILWRELTKQ